MPISCKAGGMEGPMSSSIYAREPLFRFPNGRTLGRNLIDQRLYDALAAELQASLAREDKLRDEKSDLLQRQAMLTKEFEHRITNGLQLIASLLSVQSRLMPTSEARIQLSIAARRVVALGIVHHRLHRLDQPATAQPATAQPATVEFKEFLIGLCDNLSDLLFQNRTDHAIVVEGTKLELASPLASALGLITNELITNSVKYAGGDITVRLKASAPATYALSVLDDGPGLPAGCEPATSKGLGMKLVLWLVKQIGGDLRIIARDDGHRACFTVTFRP
jgi:two-component system, sensor histidine kinase PdtaS